MKAPQVIIILIVIGMLGFLVVYSQTGIPEKPAGGHGGAGGGYGAPPAAGGYGK